jgi:hypothetical protein
MTSPYPDRDSDPVHPKYEAWILFSHSYIRFLLAGIVPDIERSLWTVAETVCNSAYYKLSIHEF